MISECGFALKQLFIDHMSYDSGPMEVGGLLILGLDYMLLQGHVLRVVSAIVHRSVKHGKLIYLLGRFS